MPRTRDQHDDWIGKAAESLELTLVTDESGSLLSRRPYVYDVVDGIEIYAFGDSIRGPNARDWIVAGAVVTADASRGLPAGMKIDRWSMSSRFAKSLRVDCPNQTWGLRPRDIAGRWVAANPGLLCQVDSDSQIGWMRWPVPGRQKSKEKTHGVISGATIGSADDLVRVLRYLIDDARRLANSTTPPNLGPHSQR